MSFTGHKTVKFRRGTTVEHQTFTGELGEITIDTDKKTIVVHDGLTLGGVPLRRDDQVETRVRYLTFRAAITQQGIPSLGFSSPENAPEPISVDENGIITGVASFDRNRGQSIQDHFMLPFEWVGPLGLEIVWRSSAIVGNLHWRIETAGIPIGGYLSNTSFNAPVELEVTPGNNPYQVMTATVEELPITGMVPEGEVFFRLTRMEDSMAATAELISLRFLVRVRGK